MKKMQDMGGFFVAAVTPYDEQGRFSAPALHKLMDKTIAEGAKGFLIGGSSAECPLLTHEERVEGLQAAAQYENREKTKLMASVAAISTDEAIEYAKTAKALGYDAMISTVPYYYKFGMKAISAYYGALREAVDLPLFLYNFPGNTGVELDIADDHIRGMLTDGTIAGVKQTSLNLYQMERTGRPVLPRKAPTGAAGGGGFYNEKAALANKDCFWSYWPDSNRRPADYESAALPTEPQ